MHFEWYIEIPCYQLGDVAVTEFPVKIGNEKQRLFVDARLSWRRQRPTRTRSIDT